MVDIGLPGGGRCRIWDQVGGWILLIDDQLFDDVHGILCNGSPINERSLLCIVKQGGKRHDIDIIIVVDVFVDVWLGMNE